MIAYLCTFVGGPNSGETLTLARTTEFFQEGSVVKFGGDLYEVSRLKGDGPGKASCTMTYCGVASDLTASRFAQGPEETEDAAVAESALEGQTDRAESEFKVESGDRLVASTANPYQGSESTSDVGPAMDVLTAESYLPNLDEELTCYDALYEIKEQIRNGAHIPDALDHLTISVCTDRAWFTPLGVVYQPYRDFPMGVNGDNRELCVSWLGRSLGALLSIPIRVGGVVGLGLLVPSGVGDFPRGVYLSGSSTRTPPEYSGASPGYEGYPAFDVELLADPYSDRPGALLPLPAVVTSVPFGQDLVKIFVDMFMRCLSRVLLEEGAVRLRRVDYPGSLTTAWEATMSDLGIPREGGGPPSVPFRDDPRFPN